MKYSRLRLQCETLTRKGLPCKAPAGICKNKSLRCRVHGLTSTGPNTIEGKARSANNIIKYNDQRASNNRQSKQ